MSNAAYTRLKPQLLHGRRILLTAFVTPSDEYFEPADGWIDPIEVALYSNQIGSNLATPNGDRRYIDSYGRDEVLWNTNSMLQNMQLRQEWGFSAPQTLDLQRLAILINRFVKGCKTIYRVNHPPVTLGTALIPAQGLQLYDSQTGMAIGPMSTQTRIIAQTGMEEGATNRLIEAVHEGLKPLPQA